MYNPIYHFIDRTISSKGNQRGTVSILGGHVDIYAAYDEMLRESYDDRLADLSYAADILSKNDFFEGDELYVFSFSSFTAQQYRIIKEAAKQCSSVTVIFTCPSELSLRGHTP